MKKIMRTVFVAAFTAVAGYSVYMNQKADTMSDLMLANIEALADEETGGNCTVSVSCTNNPNDYVKCTGKYSCERKSSMFDRWVKCDGIKTSC